MIFLSLCHPELIEGRIDAKRQSRFLLPNFPVGKDMTDEASASQTSDTDTHVCVNQLQKLLRLMHPEAETSE